MTPGLVSTVIPVFNRAQMLRAAVASVAAQDWPLTETIIVDDGSDDDTPAAIAELVDSSDGRVRSLRVPNGGPGRAREEGARVASGEFIQFLDSDDLLYPCKFRVQVAGLRADPEADISYGPVRLREHDVLQPAPAQRSGERHRTLFPALLRGPLWPTLAPLYRRSALERIGPWPDLRQLEDWVYDAQAAEAGLRLHFTEDWLAETINHPGPRLCSEWQRDEQAMLDRCEAHEQVLSHALRAGVPETEPEFREFIRSLFAMSRAAGARGLEEAARRLHRLGLRHSPTAEWDMRAVGALAAVVGWKRAAPLAERFAGTRQR